ncbi:bifunctional diaminohydroxyphosphoribosylaminopyrimidine deaminase/5-amino-6-(5-phosphoribosylamino)uracil reductase RibD [Dactylosporangium sp. AC04546]|uniref:bifunctional diaminohydroxyphosphoribosylaminopyrimidine deaminase/5-amino-6-(5-phosphoribosylamino)uracil reductase RibD n=1 Tax=Dactylosporangium sp. AC04546 TaxID=2862460 RepID=UPI001EDEE9F8|nr:bifunctional diaminohydroxyphosphoribosylaminopyrimidine deaminase/5-amino-6-(5-phosphoribosylamino)uracil reductase RibD [Dactylosporangium sp. AC04546]WVK81669.1 bifunctional diaminohydroxyphosphoribosylaminopyrimidine deaminase/5-amino-6-(5-phosphoribosylamino)uracil reductase RibD [Dactylosporangium sp. AC04546]
MDEQDLMRRAVELARLSLGETSPNPNVGAVIATPGGTIVGEGRTAPAGGPHAEVSALEQAGEWARGATAYVTLEPCNHTGRTGPCTEALIAAGVARVVAGVRDPNPLAAGGLERLRAAGLRAEIGTILPDLARDAMVGWLTAVDRGTPYVIWKFAATLDGRSAAADGTSMWITSPQAREDVHRLRAGVDAIIAGTGTVLTDDPQLTVRLPEVRRNPLRVVVGGARGIPATAKVLDDSAPTWVVPGNGGRVELRPMLQELYRRGVRSALLEGGPTLAGAFLAAGLVDRVVAYLAPKLLGAGPAALGAAGISTITEALTLDVVDLARIGPDVRLTATVKGV